MASGTSNVHDTDAGIVVHGCIQFDDAGLQCAPAPAQSGGTNLPVCPTGQVITMADAGPLCVPNGGFGTDPNALRGSNYDAGGYPLFLTSASIVTSGTVESTTAVSGDSFSVTDPGGGQHGFVSWSDNPSSGVLMSGTGPDGGVGVSIQGANPNAGIAVFEDWSGASQVSLDQYGSIWANWDIHGNNLYAASLVETPGVFNGANPITMTPSVLIGPYALGSGTLIASLYGSVPGGSAPQSVELQINADDGGPLIVPWPFAMVLQCTASSVDQTEIASYKETVLVEVGIDYSISVPAVGTQEKLGTSGTADWTLTVSAATGPSRVAVVFATTISALAIRLTCAVVGTIP